MKIVSYCFTIFYIDYFWFLCYSLLRIMEVKLISITQPLIKTKEGDSYLTPEELIEFLENKK